MTPITAPSVQMQTELLQSVYEDNNVNPNLVQYIEAHGKFTYEVQLQVTTSAV